jgi:general secretion pathway protein C
MPRQLHILFNLIALFIIIYIGVNTFYRLIGIKLHQAAGPEVVVLGDAKIDEKKIVSRSDYRAITERNIFGAEEKIAPPPEPEVKEIESLEQTSLDLSLLGTIAGDQDSARAIIFDRKKKSQNIYRVEDTVQGAVIKQIHRGKVVLRVDGRDEILYMVEEEKPGPGAGRKTAKRDIRSRSSKPPSRKEIAEKTNEEIIPLDHGDLKKSMENINELMTQVRVRPYFRRGKPEGLIVSQIQPDSVFSELGLMNGDILVNVNGKQITSPDEAFQLYNSLSSGSEVSIEITRRGQNKTFTYKIK